MPREAKKRVIFECPKCETKQPLPGSAHKTVKCIDCETEYALVRDPDAPEAPVMVEYFNQGTAPNKGRDKKEA